MTKADIRLVLVICAAALLILFALYINRTQGSYAAVSYDGTVLLKIPLMQTEERYYLVTSVHITELSKEEWADIKLPEQDYNVIMYREGKISMIAANCPDKICVHHIAVSSAGESIICLPHKLVIEIIGEKEHELDGVTY